MGAGAPRVRPTDPPQAPDSPQAPVVTWAPVVTGGTWRESTRRESTCLPVDAILAA
jgi:hypothetical protein